MGGVTTGRNDPCPCGSGRKYKRCHLAADTAANPPEPPPTTRSPIHDLDNRLMDNVTGFLNRRFPMEVLDVVEDLEHDPDLGPPFAIPWLAYTVHYEGRLGVDWYQEDRGLELSNKARSWLDAVRASWLSVWDVESVERGRIVLHDKLTGTERTVHEIAGSQGLSAGLCVLVRVIDFEGRSYLTSVHPQPLPPRYGVEVAETIRRAVRRRNAVPPERLREPKIAWRMLDEWTDAVAALRIPRRLTNTSGDELLLTQDRWRIVEGSAEDVASRLRELQFVDEQEGTFFFLDRAPEDGADVTVLGTATIDEGILRLETNSVARADALASQFEAACADRLGRRVRSHSDPMAMLKDAAQSPKEPRAPNPEHAPIVRRMKERFYENWVDEPVPLLDGRTPREAMRTGEGRRRVEGILQEIERTEAAESAEARFDVDILRRELGLG
jgi:hypothetical protein